MLSVNAKGFRVGREEKEEQESAVMRKNIHVGSYSASVLQL